MQFRTVHPVPFSAVVGKAALAARLEIKQMLLAVGWKVVSELVKNPITAEQILLQLLAASKWELPS